MYSSTTYFDMSFGHVPFYITMQNSFVHDRLLYNNVPKNWFNDHLIISEVQSYRYLVYHNECL